jgi:hypothetical protein
LLGTYVFAYFFYKKNENKHKYPATTGFAGAGVIFMLVSSLSPWALGPIMVFLGKKSIWYNLDIYFYLHFQYNGWFFMALLALLIYLFERKGIEIPETIWKKSLLWIFSGVFWGYITNTLWIDLPLYFNIIALASVFMEAWGLWILFRYLKKHFHRLELPPFRSFIFKWLVFAVFIKVGLQFLASCPYYANLAYAVRDMVIGYIHWVMLALFSVGLLFISGQLDVFQYHKKTFLFYFAGMLSMILSVWVRGVMIWQKIPVPDAVHYLMSFTALWTFISVLLIAIYGSEKV